MLLNKTYTFEKTSYLLSVFKDKNFLHILNIDTYNYFYQGDPITSLEYCYIDKKIHILNISEFNIFNVNNNIVNKFSKRQIDIVNNEKITNVYKPNKYTSYILKHAQNKKLLNMNILLKYMDIEQKKDILEKQKNRSIFHRPKILQ